MKFVGKPTVTFSEFPDEIALCFNISGCPNHCVGCSEPELALDIGEELTFDVVDHAVSENKGISLLGFLGGDQDHNYLIKLIFQIKSKYPNLKIGIYSGRNYLDFKLAFLVDYYKIGEWRMFQGDESTWKNQTAGPIVLPTSNQIMFKRDGNNLVNITDRFRDHVVNNWNSVIIK